MRNLFFQYYTLVKRIILVQFKMEYVKIVPQHIIVSYDIYTRFLISYLYIIEL